MIHYWFEVGLVFAQGHFLFVVSGEESVLLSIYILYISHQKLYSWKTDPCQYNENARYVEGQMGAVYMGLYLGVDGAVNMDLCLGIDRDSICGLICRNWKRWYTSAYHSGVMGQYTNSYSKMLLKVYIYTYIYICVYVYIYIYICECIPMDRHAHT